MGQAVPERGESLGRGVGTGCKLYRADLTCLGLIRGGRGVCLTSDSFLSSHSSQRSRVLICSRSSLDFSAACSSSTQLFHSTSKTMDLKFMSNDRLLLFKQCSFIQQTCIETPICIKHCSSIGNIAVNKTDKLPHLILLIFQWEECYNFAKQTHITRTLQTSRH